MASVYSLQPSQWYSIVATVDERRGTMLLWINMQLAGTTGFVGGLRKPPRAQDGDLTFGCGMFDGVAADACSCLISEARVTEGRARHAGEWLWSPTQAASHHQQPMLLPSRAVVNRTAGGRG